MIFTETRLKDAYIVDIELKEDERGYFARTFCQEEFKASAIEFNIAQANISYNKKKGTLRGLHMRSKGYEEAKLVRCSRGAIYDVVVDMRPGSKTYLQWEGIELFSDSRRMLYVPKGLAHGFITLEDHTELTYLISEPYLPNTETGFHWNDPALQIAWPLVPEVISQRDQQYTFITSRQLEGQQQTI